MAEMSVLSFDEVAWLAFVDAQWLADFDARLAEYAEITHQAKDAE